jgi:hypothetical protein
MDEEEVLPPGEEVKKPKIDPANPEIQALIKTAVADALKDVKTKLDAAYGKRDEALQRVAEFEQKERDAEVARLQEEGKHREAFDLQLAEMKASKEALMKRNIELTRDIDTRNALSGFSFRNEKAAKMAFEEVTSQLVQNEAGEWVHKSGVAVKDFVKTFAENEDNAFLFKQKQNSGQGSQEPRPPSGNQKKSLFEMTQDEVLKLAAEGKLPGR